MVRRNTKTTLSRIENRRLSCGPSLHGSVTSQVSLILWCQSPASLSLCLPILVFKREAQTRHGTRCKSRANKKITFPITTSSDVSETGTYNRQHPTGIPNSETAILLLLFLSHTGGGFKIHLPLEATCSKWSVKYFCATL